MNRRAGLFSMLLGAAVGALLTGLVLPFAVDEAGDSTRSLIAGETSPTIIDPNAAQSGVPGSPQDTSSPTGDTPTAATPTGATPAGTRAARTGAGAVTAAPQGAPVRIGFVLIDLGGSGGLGFDFGLDPRQQEQAIRAGVAELNERGGLAGHPIDPRFATFNVLDSFTSSGDSGRAACLKLTEDDQVMVVVGYLFPKDQLCVTREHRTPMLSDAANNLDSGFAASEGRLISVYPRAGRIMTTFVQFLDEARFLANKNVGIVSELNADPQSEVANALAQELRRAGHKVTRISRLSGDISQGASQMPVEVNQHRAAGTDVVLLLTHPLYVQQFAQQAESQGWFPKYGFSDFANGTTDPANDMPDSLDGAIGVTGAYPGGGTKDTTGWPEPAAAVACRANYERRTGQKLPARGSGDNKYSITLVGCDDLRLLDAIAARAGPSFTRDAFVAAVEVVGPIDNMARIPGGSYAPGKRDFTDFARLELYDASCDCFHPHGPFRRTP